MRTHKDFQTKVSKSLSKIDMKISFLNDGVKGLGETFKEFEADITEFMAFSAENYADHEKRIKKLEQKP